MGYLDFDFARWCSSCRAKTRFSHAAHGIRRINRILNSNGRLNARGLVTYKCPYFFGFHIGHER